MASIKDVATVADVSPATVSNVLNNRSGVSPETVKRVIDAVNTVGYVRLPPANRTGPKAGSRNQNFKNRSVGICFNSICGQDINFPLYTKILCTLERELRRHNLSTIVMNFHDDCTDDDIRADHLEGVIVFGTAFAKRCAQTIAQLGKKAVFILGYLQDSLGFECDHIIPSNPYIGMLAARYLVNRGHKTVAVINPARLHHTVLDIREDCFANYAMAKDVEVIRIHVDFSDRLNGKAISFEEEPNLAEIVRIYRELKNKPTGIFVPTDSYLVVVHKLLTRAGIKIGTDLELIGCNNEQETLAGLDPRPATIDVGIDMICYMAVERLLMSIKNQAAHSEGVVISVKADTVQGESNKFDLM